MKTSLSFICSLILYLAIISPSVSQEATISEIEKLDSLMTFAQSKIHSDWLLSLENYLLAEQIALQHQESKKLAIIYTRLAFIYRYKSNNLTESLTYRIKGYENAAKYSDTISMIRFLDNIGSIYQAFKNFETAEQYYKKADSLNFHLKDLYAQKQLELSFIALYSISKQYEKMDIHLDKASNSFKKGISKDDDFTEMANYINVAEAYLNKKDYKQSIAYTEKAYQKIKDDPSNEVHLPHVWVSLSRNYHHLEEWDKSIKYGDSAIRNAIKYYNDSELDKDFYYSYSNSLFNLGKKEEAIKVLQNFTFRTDTINKEKLINEGKNVEATNAIKKRMDTIESDKNLALVSLQKTKNRNILLLLATCFTVLVGFVFWFKFKKNQLAKELLEIKQEQAKNTIDKKNREVAAKLLRLSNTQNTFSDIINEIKEVEEEIKTTPEVKKLLTAIKNKINISNRSNFWNEFEKRFEEIHPDFYKRLNNTHNNLSRGEQLLCAYLKLHLSTKEIAKISGITVRTAEVKRTRLRKKLGLSNKDTNLNSYIQQL